METITPKMIKEMASTLTASAKTPQDRVAVSQLLNVIVVLCLANAETRTEAAVAFSQVILKMNNAELSTP